MTPRFDINPSLILLLAGVIILLCCNSCQQERKNISLQVGDTAPDFAAKDLDEKVTVLSSLKGRPIILRFFATTCRFCRADTPVFTKIHKELQEAGPQILYVGSFYEGKALLRAFAKELHVEFPILTDTEAQLADLYDVRIYPQTLFIGPDQKILASLVGALGEADVYEILKEFLPPKKTVQ